MKTATSKNNNEAATARTATASISKNPAGQSLVKEGVIVSLANPGDKAETPTPLGADVTRMSSHKLTAHPTNVRVYGSNVDADFVEAVRQHGIYDPLLITKSPNASGLHRVISGHRRLEAARQVGIADIPVIHFGSDDEDDILTALLEANRQRVKSHEQVGREYRLFLDIETRKAARRQVTNLGGQEREKIPHGEKGKARDKAAEQFGLSGVTAQRCSVVIEAIDTAVDKGQNKKAAKLREALAKSINAAHLIVAGKSKKEKAQAPAAPEKTPQPETTPDDAIKGVEVAVNFLRGQDESSLTAEQKAAWKKAVEQLVGLLEDVGVEIEVAVAA